MDEDEDEDEDEDKDIAERRSTEERLAAIEANVTTTRQEVAAVANEVAAARKEVAKVAEEIQRVFAQLDWMMAASRLSIRISSMTPVAKDILLKYYSLQYDDGCSTFLRTMATGPNKDTLDEVVALNIEWGDSETGSVRLYQLHLDKLLDILSDRKFLFPMTIHNDTQFLTTKAGDVRLPFQLRGTSDVIFYEYHRKSTMILSFCARVICQLKVNCGRDYARYVAQSCAELFALDLKATEPIVALLTDLREDWTFMWLSFRGGKAHFH